jgi:hypothetical protein
MTDIQWPEPGSIEFSLTPRNEPRVMVYVECDSQNGQGCYGTHVKRGAHIYLMYRSDAEKARKRFARTAEDDADEKTARGIFERELAKHIAKSVGGASGAERDRLTDLAKASFAISVQGELHKIRGDGFRGLPPFRKFVVSPVEVDAPRTPESAAEQQSERLIAALTKAIGLVGQKQGGR